MHNWSKYAKDCKSMKLYRKVIILYAKVCTSRRKYGRKCKPAIKYSKVCKSLQKCAKAEESIGENANVQSSMKKVWKSKQSTQIMKKNMQKEAQ